MAAYLALRSGLDDTKTYTETHRKVDRLVEDRARNLWYVRALELEPKTQDVERLRRECARMRLSYLK